MELQATFAPAVDNVVPFYRKAARILSIFFIVAPGSMKIDDQYT
jgi:hypothetical protein